MKNQTVKKHSNNPNHTNQTEVSFRGCKIQVWYNEASASPFAWMAFVSGLGTSSGSSSDEAIEAAKSKITERQADATPANEVPIFTRTFDSAVCFTDCCNHLSDIKADFTKSNSLGYSIKCHDKSLVLGFGFGRIFQHFLVDLRDSMGDVKTICIKEFGSLQAGVVANRLYPRQLQHNIRPAFKGHGYPYAN